MRMVRDFIPAFDVWPAELIIFSIGTVLNVYEKYDVMVGSNKHKSCGKQFAY